mmetsp:Transcript_62218/g.192886  ORF Transcript_62218/g.192886 Transcript_62218/m.192886 type:complete len:292 (-) Transcript_62218:111-986(-)
MRSSSLGSSGLWSSDSSSAFPLRQSTARESPQFATVRRRGRAGVLGVSVLLLSQSMRATMAVLPMRLKALPLSADSRRPAMRLSGPGTALWACAVLPFLRRKESMVSMARWRALLVSCSLGTSSASDTSEASSVLSAVCSLALAELGLSLAALSSSGLPKFAAQAASTLGNSFEAMSDTCPPPCPSKTAKRAWLASGLGREPTTHVASSIAGRQPCISAEAHSKTAPLPPSVFFCRLGARTGPPPEPSQSGCTSFAITKQTVTVITPFRVQSWRRSVPGICSTTNITSSTK